jgi:hypothetical protein
MKAPGLHTAQLKEALTQAKLTDMTGPSGAIIVRPAKVRKVRIINVRTLARALVVRQASNAG